MALTCNAGDCLALATHGSVCAVHARQPGAAARRQRADFLSIGIDYDFRPASYRLFREPASDSVEWTAIATIFLNTFLSTSTSVEAKDEDAGLVLRVRDDEDGEYVIPKRMTTWAKPLTLRELITVVDAVKGPAGRGLVFGPLRRNARHDTITRLERFVEVTSPFYSDLARHYESASLRWLEERVAR